MVDIKPQIVAALSKLLPTYHELFIDSTAPVPCITYREEYNTDKVKGDTLEYSDIGIAIKLWADDIKTLTQYADRIDRVMKNIGFIRGGGGGGELLYNGRAMKLLNYSAMGVEQI